jgi:hypothetical protein
MLLLQFWGGLLGMSQALGLPVWLVLVLQWAIFILAGVLYGKVFGRAANDHRAGWLLGISYSYLAWMIGSVAVLQTILGRPLATGQAAMGLFGAYLLYGVVLGFLFPHIHRQLQRRLHEFAVR